MSFFGFDTTLPRDRPQQQSKTKGLFEHHDPFAALNRESGNNNGEMLDFETYDGLAQQLDESGDTFNDDTFGGDEPISRQTLGNDFDFAGQTARVMQQHGEQYAPQLPTQRAQTTKPARTGYEAYKEPEYIPKLEADASIWGQSIGKKAAPAAEPHARTDSSAGKKVMSLEEVEAMLQSQQKPTPPIVSEHERQAQGLRAMLGLTSPPNQQPPLVEQSRPVQILQRPHQPQLQTSTVEHHSSFPQSIPQSNSPQPPRPHSQDFRGHPPQPVPFQPPPQQGIVGTFPSQTARGPAQHSQLHHQRGPSYNGPPITQAQQMMQMSAEDREAYMAEEAKRAKRNHKIFLLSKYNGLMTPQDKNFITRIQLQQLITATGGVDNEPGSEEQLAEDFYYQVYAQIKGPPGGGVPGQPLSQFAQTYLFQTGSRYGYGRSRHHPRGGDNHVQRMEQQVARAVEAAKARPKNKQLVVEGSLGKIAFSNSKTPRPLLNLKRLDSETKMRLPTKTAAFDRKAALRDIERMYTVLMKLEAHERKLPPPPTEDSPPEVIEGHMRWRSEMQQLNQQLWEALKVMEPIQPHPSTPHPFIQVLSHSKGKKAIPRVFRHLDDQQRLTMLTLIAIHLDQLDVIRDAYPPTTSTAEPNPTSLPPRVRDEVELFTQAVLPPLFSYVNEAPLNIIIGLLGLMLDRTHIHGIVRTKVGVSVLTMLISRAELVKQAQLNNPPSASQQEDWQQWNQLYNRLFDTVEPVLPFLFPSTSGEVDLKTSDDMHIWQFLAAMGVGANPDQQQRLVLGVKEKVMETVGAAKALPETEKELSQRRLGEVNLFMRAIGLDVELLG